MKPTLKTVSIEEVKIGDRFRKDYGDIEDLALDIDKNGIYHPPLVDQEMNLLSGGRRMAALKHLQRTKIQVLVHEVSGQLQAREIELLENIMRKDLSWIERAKLVREINRLYQEKNPDWFTEQTGELIGRTAGRVRQLITLADMIDTIPQIAQCKNEDEAQRIFNSIVEDMALAELAGRQTKIVNDGESVEEVSADEPAEAPKKKKPVGDLTPSQVFSAQAYDRYKLQDVFEGLAKLPNESIHLIECDGPYAINLHDQKRLNVDSTKWNQYEEIDAEKYPDFCQRLAKELFRVSAPNTWTIFWYGNQNYEAVLTALGSAGYDVDVIPCLWIKPSGQTNHPQSRLARAYEAFLIAGKGAPILQKPGRVNYFSFPTVAPQDKFHPTQKPMELYEELFATFAFPPPPRGPNWLILSVFAGSGTALLTAQKLGYRVMGFDIVEEYKKKYMVMVKDFWGRRVL